MASSLPSSAQQQNICKLVVTLQNTGVWPLLDSLYILAAPTAQNASIDWALPSRTLTVSGSPTFAANKGYTGDGVSAFLDTNYNPATNAVNLSQNSNTFGVWSLTSNIEASGVWEFGQTNYAIGPFATSGDNYFSRNAEPTSVFTVFGAGPGLFISSRNSSAGFGLFLNNGVPLNSTTNTSKGTNIGVSGTEQQGWATDGSFYYTSSTQGTVALRQRSLVDWSIIQSNTNPFSGFPATPGGPINHPGAADVSGGLMYVPASFWDGFCAGDNQGNQIAVYSTAALAFVSTTPITVADPTGDMSAFAADTDHNILWGVDYCDPTVLYRFNLATLAQLPSISMSISPFSALQGIAYKSSGLYLVGLDVKSNPYELSLDLTGTFLSMTRLSDLPANLEGDNFSGSSLGVMSDNTTGTGQVYFYTLPAPGTNLFAQASTAINSQTFTILKRNGAAGAFSTNQISATFIAGNLTQTQMSALYYAIQTYLRAVGAI